MKLTTRTEYTLLALIYIARHQDVPFVKIDDICSACDIPKKYLENLLSALKTNGFIKAKRGASGGYQLAQEAKRISAASIIRLMDGALAPTDSVSVYFYAETPLQKEPKVMALLKSIRDYTAQTLESATLEDLV
jgi:Rrf2 family transcriptional regulator, cysteine metabolism repressor